MHSTTNEGWQYENAEVSTITTRDAISHIIQQPVSSLYSSQPNNKSKQILKQLLKYGCGTSYTLRFLICRMITTILDNTKAAHSN
jgi:hypothetical protein